MLGDLFAMPLFCASNQACFITKLIGVLRNHPTRHSRGDDLY
jgi:hypothetical protein